MALRSMALVGGIVISMGDSADLNVRLNNGIDMPKMAFAANLWSDDVCKNATGLALQAGFTNIWSSVLVGAGCQSAQAEAIKSSGIDRSELFIAGTVNTAGCSGLDGCYNKTKLDAEEQFSTLEVDMLDMLMLDYPAYSGCDGILGQWKAFEEIYNSGRVRTIAVSNFSPDQIDCVINSGGVIPSVNMLQYSVGEAGTKVADNAQHGIILQAYSPLRGGSLVRDEMCASIGQAHNKSAVQVAFRWILQTNGTVATQSTTLSHLVDDLVIFDFELTDDEMSRLNNRSSYQQHALV